MLGRTGSSRVVINDDCDKFEIVPPRIMASDDLHGTHLSLPAHGHVTWRL
jgi:hypothetical protein